MQQRLIAEGRPAERLALIGTAAGKWPMPPVPADTILIHGEVDDTITLLQVLDWARPQDIPVIVIPEPTTSSTAGWDTSKILSRNCGAAMCDAGLAL